MGFNLLNIEFKKHDIAVFDDIIFAFLTNQSGFFGLYHAAATDQILIRNRFGPDKTALKIGMNDARTCRGQHAFLKRPGPPLIRTGRNKSRLAQ